MIFTDGKRTVDIRILNLRTGENFAEDFFASPYNEKVPGTDVYRVKDVQYCIDYAEDPAEGADCMEDNETGEITHDPNVVVKVIEPPAARDMCGWSCRTNKE